MNIPHRLKKADNEAFLESGVIWSVQKGPQDAQSVHLLRQQTEALMRAQREAGQKVVLLADLSAVTKTDSGARLEAKAFLDTDFDVFAVVGNAYLQPIIAYVLKITGKQEKIHYFASRPEALAWLGLPSITNEIRKKRFSFNPHFLPFLSIVVVAIAIMVTLVAWERAKNQARVNNLSHIQEQARAVSNVSASRFQAYIDALRGFRGLFHSSDLVSEKEFSIYFRSLNLERDYPGFNAISFVSKVTDAQKSAFLTRIRTDTSLYPTGNPSFNIIPEGKRQDYFVRTFIEGIQTGRGLDLKVSGPRREVLEHARDSGKEAATGTLNLFNADGTESSKKGFLLTIPVYALDVPGSLEARRQNHRGFIDANFDYQIFLSDVLRDALPDQLHAEFTDTDGNIIYESSSQSKEGWQKVATTFSVGGQTWTVNISGPEQFGMSQAEVRTPTIVLIAGLMLSSFLAILFWLQLRARQRAVALAELMTDDLRQERNIAVATKSKDEAILASIGDGVFALDNDGKIILFNQAAERITGFLATEVIGQYFDKVLQFRDESGTKPHIQFIAEAQQGKLSQMQPDTMVITKQGQFLPVADSAAPIFDAKNQQQGVIVVFRDISVEQAFQARLSQLAAIVESSDDAIISKDMQGFVVSWNKGAESLYGYTAKEIVGKSMNILLPTDRPNEIEEILAKIKAGHRVDHLETVRRTKDGRDIDVSITVSPLRNEEGAIVGASSIARDISQSKHFERVIKESNERFELVAMATSEVIYDLNITANSLWWNDALYKQYGYTKQENTTSVKWWMARIHPDDTLKINDALTKLMDGQKINWNMEYRFKRADNTYIFVRDRAFVQYNSRNIAVRMVGSLLDVTKQKTLDRAKDEFISLVSHQLRTPLTAIRLYTEMLIDGQVGPLATQQQDYVEKIDISTKRMIQLVGDILNVSRIELGRLKIEPKPTDITALIQSYIEEVQPLAAKKQVQIAFDSAAQLEKISLDPVLFGQIVHNLLTNAIRYSNKEEGKVDVAMTAHDDVYELAVRDNGIGIPIVAQSRIFERFFRADNAVRAEGEGTGLGLYLIKIIMEQAGGKVRFESEEGKGTVFYVTLPKSGMTAKDGDKGLS